MNRSIFFAIILGIFTPLVQAATPVIDSDSDGIPDTVELALGRNPLVADSYPDTDGDGIPDIIETEVTHTDPNVDDRVLCSGTGGAANLTGQWDGRVAANLGAAVNIKTDQLVGASFCHTGSGVTIYVDEFATSVTFDGTNLTASWTSSDGTTTVNAVYTSGAGTYSLGRLEGTLTIPGGSVTPIRFDRRALAAPSGANLSGVIGLQLLRQINPNFGLSVGVDRPINPSNYSTQFVVAPNGVSIVMYDADGYPHVGYYVPSVGAFALLNQFPPEVVDADNDGNADDTITTKVTIRGVVLEAASTKIGGMVRGNVEIDTQTDLNYATSPGIDSYSHESNGYYGKAQVPLLTFATYNRPGGATTSLSLNNVPSSASQISIAGTGLVSTDLFGGTSGLTISDALKIRSRVPGFTDGENVGLSGNGTDLQISNVSYNSADGVILANGTYTFTVTGDADGSNPTTYSGTYTAPGALLPIATGLSLDSTFLSTSTPLTGVRPGASHTLTWNAVAGAAYYVVRIRPSNDSSEQWWNFTTGTSMVFDPRLLAPTSSYKIEIEARAGNSGPAQLNRSRTDSYEIMTDATFLDVPTSYFAWNFVESLNLARITSGCDANNYCPDISVTRAQMAVFLERGMRGYTFTPPTETGTVFADVLSGSFAAAWIEKLAADGITSGCGGGNYCPNTAVSRAQMAVFLLRAKYSSSYTPPASSCTTFADVPPGSFACEWIEQMLVEGITSGCGGGNYCPNAAVTRGQMAVFLNRAFGLPSY
jgi:hypothetical protein